MFTNIDNFLTQQGYADLVGQPLHKTQSELRNKEEERVLEILETHIDADDPILSIKIDLLKILFTNQQYHLTEEDEALPLQLLHKEDLTAQACAVKTWHRTLHKDLEMLKKLRPFLGLIPNN